MKKVLVTGANGFLGANIVRQLLDDGYLVKAMLRKASNRLSLNGANCQIFEGEITNPNNVMEAISDCNYVIHAAAKTSQFPTNIEAYQKTNIDATKILIEASKHCNIERFIFISTANCFTNGTIENPGTESSGFMPWLKDSGYAFSKYLAQEEVLREAKENAFPAIVLSPTFLVGAFDAKPSSGKLLLYAFKNRILFHPPGGKSFVDVNFAAKAISKALTIGKIGECYLLAGENLSYKEFFRKVGKLSKKSKLLIPIPKFFLLAIGKLTDILQQYFSLPLPLNSVNARLLGLDNYFLNNKAKTELGLKNTNIKYSINQAINWFQLNKY